MKQNDIERRSISTQFSFFFYGQAEELKASLPSGELDVRDSNCADE